MTDHETVDGRRRAETARIDNRVSGPGAEAVVQAGSIHQVSIAGHPAGRGHRPGQLPPDVRFFTGRAKELLELDALLGDVGDAGGSSAVVISAVAGAGGMGKTSLAVRWAHRVRDRFPDGQLYVNLRGYDPSPPLSPAQALDQFLRALGTAGEAIPQDMEAMAGLYRSLLADQHMLIVLDNAATSEQVRPLLPNTPGCLVLVTSRSRLSGLVARDGARLITVDELAPAEAATLLRAVIGPARADVEPDALRELARRCAGLPLALRIAAGRIVDRPHLSLADLVADLADEQNRLDMLATDDDETTAVRTVFSWSYRALPADPARMFRLLGLHPGPTISIPAAAALLCATPALAQRHLDVLAGVHLLTQVDRDRYQLHDLLRDYAAEQVNLHETPPERVAAIRRVLAWYLHTAHASRRWLYPQAPQPPIAAPPVDCRPLEFESRHDALRWCDREHANLTAAARAAAEHGHHDLAAQLPTALVIFLHVRARWTDLRALCATGLACAQRIRDPKLATWLAGEIGDACYNMARWAEAMSHHQLRLAVARNTDDRWNEGCGLGGLGKALIALRRLEEGADHCRRALTIYQALQDRRCEAMVLVELGDALRQQKRLNEALDHQRRALTLLQQTGDRWNEALCRRRLGSTYSDVGQFDDAIDQLRRSAAIAQDLDHRFRMAEALQDLGDVLNLAGHAYQAQESWRDALATFEELNAYPQAAVLRPQLASSPKPRDS